MTRQNAVKSLRHDFEIIGDASPTSLPVRIHILTSERDDAVSLLHRRHAFHDFIDRAVLQSSHSQINRDTAQDISGNLLEDQVAQLLADDHDLEDPGSP